MTQSAPAAIAFIITGTTCGCTAPTSTETTTDSHIGPSTDAVSEPPVADNPKSGAPTLEPSAPLDINLGANPEDPLNSSPGAEDTSCADSWGGTLDGSVTYYTFDQGTAAIGDVNCSYGIEQFPDRVRGIRTGAGEYFAALNTEDYDDSAMCGACVEISRKETGARVVATVVDQCPLGTNPKCVKGHIDLSKQAFLQLGEEVEGYLGGRAGRDPIEWAFVPCDAEANLALRLKEPENRYWNEIIVESSRYPVAAVEVRINDEWVQTERQSYNYFRPPGGWMGESPYEVKVTDTNGQVVETVAELTEGSQLTATQFECIAPAVH